MKATMDENGLITLAPDNPTEAYALKAWVEACQVVDKATGQAFIAPAILKVDTTWPPAAPITPRPNYGMPVVRP